MSSGPPVDEFLASMSPEARAMVQRLRRLIRDVYPAVVERAVPAARSLRYFAGERSAGPVLDVSPDRDQVLLGFARSPASADPKGLLSGDGARQLRITASGVFDERYYRSLVEAAFSQHRRP
jgi:hypothetical protein